MGIFQNDRAPELFVPDLSKPTGALVDADGNVTCVTCHATLPQAKADVVGLGYRCPACTATAELSKLTGGRSDIDANLTSGDRGALRAFGWKAIGLGVALVGGGLAVYAFVGPVRFGSYLIVAGIGSVMVGGFRIANAK